MGTSARTTRRVRRLVAVTVLIGLLGAGALPGTGAAQDTPVPPTEDRMRAFAIEVPGQCGHVSTAPPAQECPHFSDQLPIYAGLVKDDDVTEEELSTHFHSMQFGPGPDIESEYSPIEGVTVYRDTFGVPHIYANDLNNASYALGYVSAEDRLFEMDVFRHAARGTLTELIGDDYLEMDIATRREGYTEEEIQKMFDDFDDKFGALGKQVQDGLTAYAAGVNQYIDEAMLDPRKMPVEYGATFTIPEEWTVNDTLFLVVLQLRVFGETAGGEIQNAGLYAHLTKKLGVKLGRKVYNDLVFQNDPSSPTSLSPADANFRTQPTGRPKFASVAIPDKAEEVATRVTGQERARERFLASLGFKAPASNALLVSADESATGNPLQIGAPQVGYAAPGFFMEVDVHAPGVDFRGPAVPGASALIPLGRGRDFAWSLTTGFSDAVDTRAEKLCNPEGEAKPTLESNAYVFKGECREMESREETFTIKPSASDPNSPPRQETRTFYRTIHGPVFARTLVKGQPVAFVKERFFWKREVDSVPQFLRWNTKIDSIDDFTAAARDFTMSFNAFYADANNIGYYHVGYYPKRTRGVHPSLPIWGTGRWEWKGRRPFRTQPHLLNPDKGWVANWNNKPARGWNSLDGIKWGSIQRAQLLEDKMRRLLKGPRKAKLSDLVDVIRKSATQDTRGLYLGPKMLRMAGRGGDEKFKQAVGLVRKWVGAGAHRHNKDDDDNMDQGAALAIFDEWYDQLVHLTFDDELGKDAYPLIPAPVSDYTPETGSSFWFDFSSYLKKVFNPKTRRRMALNYCNDRTTKGRTETCASLVVEALNKAIAKLTEEQGADMSAWTTPREDITFQAFGAGSVDPIPWQNRGTHNHVVEILSDAGPIEQPSPPSGGATPTPTPTG